jgi:hypothetical protein
MRTNHDDDTDRERVERALDKSFEQEPRYRAPDNWRSRERMALKLAMVGTPEEALAARGFIVPHRELAEGADRVTVNADPEDLHFDYTDEPKPELLPIDKPWRPSDENGGAS